MPEQNELPDPAKLLKKVLAEAHFENTDIGGAVFSMLDSLSYDINAEGFEWSDATEDLMQEVVNILAKDYDELRTDDEEEEEDDIEADVSIIAHDDVEVDETIDEEVDSVIVTDSSLTEEPEEIDDVEELPDLSDLEEDVPNGQGNQEVANKG